MVTMMSSSQLQQASSSVDFLPAPPARARPPPRALPAAAVSCLQTCEAWSGVTVSGGYVDGRGGGGAHNVRADTLWHLVSLPDFYLGQGTDGSPQQETRLYRPSLDHTYTQYQKGHDVPTSHGKHSEGVTDITGSGRTNRRENYEPPATTSRVETAPKLTNPTTVAVTDGNRLVFYNSITIKWRSTNKAVY